MNFCKEQKRGIVDLKGETSDSEEITYEELKHAIGRMKNGLSAGLDEVK